MKLTPGFSEWALLVPAWTIVTVLLTYFMYFSMAIRATPGFSELFTFTGQSPLPTYVYGSFFYQVFFLADSRAQYPDASNPNPYLTYARLDSIPEAYDIPIGLVNRVLYDPVVRAEQTTDS
jgi:phosphatidylinositol glycan class P protein